MRKSILIILFTLIGVFSARAYDFIVTGVYYNIISYTDENAVEVTSSPEDYKYSGSVVIPSTVTYSGTTYTVTSIGNEAFRECRGLTSVNIPESVTSINDHAFLYCSGLTSVNIPESVETIGQDAFDGTSISRPLYNSKIFAYLPRDYSGVYTIPDGIQTIAEGAFHECSGLTSLTIPESLTSIQEDPWGDPFAGTAISAPLYNSKIFFYMPRTYSGKYTIPSGIQSIAPDAFKYRQNLTSVTIPESVTDIGNNAFWNCTGLTSVTISEGVTSIGGGAFRGCRGLWSVTIPASVTHVGTCAFMECSGLRSVEWNARYCDDDYYSSGSTPFYFSANERDNTLITSITFGREVEHIPAYLCYSCSSLSWVNIPESVTSIGECAFYGTSISSPLYNSKMFAYLPQSYSGEYAIPDGIQSIAPTAFLHCSSLTSVTIPESVTSIGKEVFGGCTGLTSVTIPESVTSIGLWAFYHCTSIRSPLYNSKIFAYMPQKYSNEYEIPSGIQSIAPTAFYECSELMSVTIPGSVDTIWSGAFYECSNLTSVTSLSKAPPYCIYDAFSFKTSTNIERTLYVPRGCKSAYESVWEWRQFSSIKELPGDPNDPDNPTPNEKPEADNFHVYTQGHTIHLSEYRGLVQVYNVAGQCVYNGHATAIPVSQSGVYIVAVGSQRFKVLMR